MTCVLITNIRWQVVTGFLNCETSCSRGGLGFESRTESLASCLNFFLCFLSSPLRQMLGTVKWSRPHLSTSLKFVIHSYLNIWHFNHGRKKSLRSRNQERRTASFKVFTFVIFEFFTRDFNYLNLFSIRILFLRIKSTIENQAHYRKYVLHAEFLGDSLWGFWSDLLHSPTRLSVSTFCFQRDAPNF